MWLYIPSQHSIEQNGIFSDWRFWDFSSHVSSIVIVENPSLSFCFWFCASDCLECEWILTDWSRMLVGFWVLISFKKTPHVQRPGGLLLETEPSPMVYQRHIAFLLRYKNSWRRSFAVSLSSNVNVLGYSHRDISSLKVYLTLKLTDQRKLTFEKRNRTKS